jgi:hypothetical protein
VAYLQRPDVEGEGRTQGDPQGGVPVVELTILG